MEHGQGGYEVRALHVLGEITARSNSLQQAEGHYRDALALAEKIDFCPLAAHCHLSLAKLYRRRNQRERAQEHLAMATTMYREMDMLFWLEQSEAEDMPLPQLRVDHGHPRQQQASEENPAK
jgi:hypothetical protein